VRWTFAQNSRASCVRYADDGIIRSVGSGGYRLKIVNDVKKESSKKMGNSMTEKSNNSFAFWCRTNCFALLLLLAVIPVDGEGANRSGSAVSMFSGGAGVSLETRFFNPPDEAKPWVFWHWMNGHITREGITADLEAMADVGIGGAMIFNLRDYMPRGPVDFASEEWFALFGHAVREAARLGLKISMHTTDGWSQAGGPWISPGQSMKQLVWSGIEVSGSQSINTVLPVPSLPMLGNGKMSLLEQHGIELPPIDLDYYRDIAVLAVPVAQLTAKPVRITSSRPGLDIAPLVDGDARTALTFVPDASDPNPWILMEYAKPFTTHGLAMQLGPLFSGHGGVLEASDDGISFREITSVGISSRSGHENYVSNFSFEKATGRFFRVRFSRANPRMPIVLPELQLRAEPRVVNSQAKSFATRSSFGAFATPRGREPDSVPAVREVVDLTDKMRPDGSLAWDAPAGNWLIQRIGEGSNGQVNFPPTPKGSGLEVSKLSGSHLEYHFNSFLKRCIEEAGPLAGTTFAMVHSDSWEAGCQNSEENVIPVFIEKYGYDPVPYLPATTGLLIGSSELSERFLWDYRQLIADLLADQYYGKLRELAHRYGLIFSAQVYGGTYDRTQSAGRVDVPMAEFWVYQQPRIFLGKGASYGAHLYGRRIISAEAFTGGGGKDKWRSTPASMKILGDAMFSSGVNRFVFHSYAMQPWVDRVPGMTMGPHGIHFNRGNTWWNQGRAWLDYLSRSQFLLQQGDYVADVLFFDYEESATGNPHARLSELLPPGFEHDAADRESILERSRVENGKVVIDPDPLPGETNTTGPMRYEVLVLPDNERRMTLPFLRKIKELVGAGATVMAPRPVASPSLEGYPEVDNAIRDIASEVWGACDGRNITENLFGKGRVVWGKSVDEVLRDRNILPDFEFKTNSDESVFYWIHRRAEDADIYFVANGRDVEEVVDLTFRVSGKRPEIWSPQTGRINTLSPWQTTGDGRTTLRLQMDPAESVFVIFRSPALAGEQITELKRDGDPVGIGSTVLIENLPEGLSLITDRPGDYQVMTGSGAKGVASVKSIPDAVPLEGPWDLRFQPDRGAPPNATFDRLVSWSERPEEGIRYFSGTAAYRKEFSLPDSAVNANRRLTLDLGRVEVIAEVLVNGHNLGILWKHPFSVDISKVVTPGINKLEVRVTNLWANRLIGDEKLPPYFTWTDRGAPEEPLPGWVAAGPVPDTGRVTFAMWRHYIERHPLLPSGLLGPVMIRSAAVIKLEPNN